MRLVLARYIFFVNLRNYDFFKWKQCDSFQQKKNLFWFNSILGSIRATERKTIKKTTRKKAWLVEYGELKWSTFNTRYIIYIRWYTLSERVTKYFTERELT